MFSILQRGQHVLNFSLTLVGFVSAFIIATSWFQLYSTNAFALPSSIPTVTPSATVKFSRRFGSAGGKSKENNKFIFDLESDLTPLFNWNTKQVFAYLTAEYPGKSEGSSNKVVYWDKIIQSKDKANLSITNERSKYSVWDIEESFRNREAIVKLEWNIQPYVGSLVYGETNGETKVVFPDPVSSDQKPKQKKKKKQQQQY